MNAWDQSAAQRPAPLSAVCAAAGVTSEDVTGRPFAVRGVCPLSLGSFEPLIGNARWGGVDSRIVVPTGRMRYGPYRDR